ncbi:hypothetical protein MUK42_37227 [Musa troglodytarum]|uniref:Uncharacterized protein n=1 Tax=Musa troglodytarum TaxID=320322 RepID=A0A9E7GWE5_9LILI|nr:hypothetical protein MUK42_37227 [Musa troglodytarum]
MLEAWEGGGEEEFDSERDRHIIAGCEVHGTAKATHSRNIRAATHLIRSAMGEELLGVGEEDGVRLIHTRLHGLRMARLTAVWLGWSPNSGSRLLLLALTPV